jgi:hypothetical protein
MSGRCSWGISYSRSLVAKNALNENSEISERVSVRRGDRNASGHLEVFRLLGLKQQRGVIYFGHASLLSKSPAQASLRFLLWLPVQSLPGLDEVRRILVHH